MNAPVVPKRPNFVLLALTAGIALALAALVVFHRSPGQSDSASRSKDRASDRTAAKQAGSSSVAIGDLDASGVGTWSEEKWQRRLAAARIADYPALMKYAMQIKDDLVRAKVVGSLTAKWINQDLRNFIAFVDAMDVDDKEGNAIWKALTPAWEYALPLLNDRAASMSELSDILHRVVGYIASVDPSEAVVWSHRWLQGDMLASALASSAVEMSKASAAKKRLRCWTPSKRQPGGWRLSVALVRY